jgi:hypothetical protein
MRPAPISKTLWLGLLHGGVLYIALLLPSSSAHASSGASSGALLATAGVTTTTHLVPASALLSGDTVLLSRGATYRARLKLNFFQCFASRSKIVRKLQERGFGAVRLFMSARELPGDWPRPFRTQAGHCERYAEGTWTRDTRQQKRPSAIEKLWQLK